MFNKLVGDEALLLARVHPRAARHFRATTGSRPAMLNRSKVHRGRTMRCEAARTTRAILMAGFLAGSVCMSTTLAQLTQEKGNPTATPSAAASSTLTSSATRKGSRYRPVELPPRAIDHYQLIWGVDSFKVKSAESGQMIRFSYRVVNAEKAKAVNDKKANPYLLDEKAHVKLVVPTMEKVGQLRQSSTPETGRLYWMVFSNKGGFVKPGDLVSVVIGKFRVDGLVVE
jgi:hypothetical protein